MGDRKPFEFAQIHWIGTNRLGWEFGVGRIEDDKDRWLGFALARKQNFLHIFAEVSEGATAGMTSLFGAIKLTSALAVDPAQGFGGVDRWLVPGSLRGNPDDYRCPVCDEVGCNDDHIDLDHDDDEDHAPAAGP